MEASYRAFGEKFSAAIIAKDYASAHMLLAPWLKKKVTPEKLREEIEQHVREMCKVWSVEDAIHPAACDLDGNSSIDVEGLREPDLDNSVPDIPAEVTDANYRYWMCQQFKPAEGAVEFDAFFDLWLALVEHEGALRIGYYKFTDPD
jgi:hypothetical protein